MKKSLLKKEKRQNTRNMTKKNKERDFVKIIKRKKNPSFGRGD